MRSTADSFYRVLVSAFVTAVLVGQCVVTFGRLVGFEFGLWYWPLISYPMYSTARQEGDTIDAYDLLEGTLRDGTVVEIPMESLGLNLWYYRNLVSDLKKDDPSAIEIFMRRYPWRDELVELRIKSFPVMVTRDGPAEKPSEVLHTLSFAQDGTEAQ